MFSVPAVPAPPPPVVSIVAPASAAQDLLVTFTADEVECSGERVAFLTPPAVSPDITTSFRSAQADASPAALPDVIVQFRLDESGRALSIKRLEPPPPSGPGLYADSSDIEPALALARLPAGKAHASCQARFRGKAVPLKQAPVNLLSQVAAFPLQPADRPKAIAVLLPPQSNCQSVRPQPRVLAYPDRNAVQVRPNGLDHAAVQFDVGAHGKPTNIRIIASTGNGTLEKEMTGALSQSVFEAKAAVGCVVAIGKRSDDVLLPPERPKPGKFGPQGAGCPDDDKLIFRSEPRFPHPFQRRNVDGWAVVRYDIAPWGELGNMQVLAAEPAADFGKSAEQALKAAKAPEQTPGAANCIATFAFRMADGPAPVELADPR